MTASDLQRLINDPEDSEFGEYLHTYGQSSIQELVIMNGAEEEDQVIQMDADAPDHLDADNINETQQRFQQTFHVKGPVIASCRQSRQFDSESIKTNIVIADDIRRS